MIDFWIQEVKDALEGWKYGAHVTASPLPHTATSHYVDVGGGAKVYCEESRPDGEVLFFLYGLGCAISHWKHQIHFFADVGGQQVGERKPYRIVWMDFRGHGHSREFGKPGEFSISTFVDDIARVFTALNISRATLLGQSMGGTVALAFANRYPQLVDRLVLQGSPPQSPSKTFNVNYFGSAAWKAMIRLNEESPALVRLLYRGLPVLGRPMMEAIRIVGFNANLVSVEDVKEYTEALVASNPNVFWELARDLEEFDIGKFQSPILARTLIIAGRQDNCVTGSAIKYLADHLPNSEIALIDHGSHCPHLDDPPLVNQLIDQFLTAKDS